MSKIIVTKGIQGSGKSTWAREFCEKNPDWIRVSRDDLRNMRGQYWIPKQEDLITMMEADCIRAALTYGSNVIIDAMNLDDNRVASRMRGFIEEGYDFSWDYKDFTDVPLETCIARDLKRPNSIGEKVIRETYNKYLNKTVTYKENPELPHAIIVDIDGTIALRDEKGRSPYDWARVGEDLPHKPVIEIVRRFCQTHRVIIFSGRDAVCKGLTIDWLNTHVVPFHEIYMRPEGNTEKDTIIKRRLFEEHVRGKYYVDFVLDDRLQVCRMWQSIGLNLLRVGDPDADF